MPANQEQGVYFSGGTPELSIDTTAYAPGLLGKVVRFNVGTIVAPLWRHYQYVKAGGSVTARAVLAWNGVSKIGYEVVVGAAAAPTNNGLFCGVSAADSTVTSGQYFWMVLPVAGTTAKIAHNIASNAPSPTLACSGSSRLHPWAIAPRSSRPRSSAPSG